MPNFLRRSLSLLLFVVLATSCSVTSVKDKRNPASVEVNLQQVGQKRTIWPTETGFVRETETGILETPACQEFIGTSTQQQGLKPLHTDQIMVLKNGRVVFEWANDKKNVFRLDQTHILWSASKTVTATVLAAAIQAGLKTPSKNLFGMETSLSEFFPLNESRLQYMKNPDVKKEQLYNEIKIKHFFMMSTGMHWDESYTSLLESSFLPGLYGAGRKNIPRDALLAPMDYAPGQRWNYSGGNANLLMAILSQLTGPEYHQAPQKLLFRRLGMSKSFFERDYSGYFIGSSYAYMSPEDMLRFGYLYLNGGYWKGEQILPTEFINNVARVSDALASKDEKGMTITPYDYIKDEGVFSNSSFWLNQPVLGHWRQDGNDLYQYDREFPNSPRDMFFAAGHYGQLIIVLPSQDMVIVRTGQDGDGYWGKINKLTSQAVTCFDQYGQNNIETTPVEPEHDVKTLGKKIKNSFSGLGSKIGQLGMLGSVKDAFTSGLIQGIAAKELCSCVYVEKLGPENLTSTERLKLCRQNTPTDGPKIFVNMGIRAEVSAQNEIMARGSLDKTIRRARFTPGEGCRLLLDNEK